MFEKIIGMRFQPHIMIQYIVARIAEQLQVPKNRLLLPAEYYDKILVVAENYSYVGLLGKLENNFVVVNYNSINDTNESYLDCTIIDGIDYRHLLSQLILSILTNYDISRNEIEPFDFDNDFIAIVKITENMNNQLYFYTAENLLLQVNFALSYNAHFSEKGFILRENLNYLRQYKDIDFVYDYDIMINPIIGISFWNYSITVNFDNFVKLFKELYTYALTLKNLN